MAFMGRGDIPSINNNNGGGGENKDLSGGYRYHYGGIIGECTIFH